MIYGKSRNISISFTIISQKGRICKGLTRKSETKKLCKIVEILQVAVKRVKKAAPQGAALIMSVKNVDRESADPAEELQLDSKSVVCGNAVALLIYVSIDPALICDM